jgi:hypothetical protein
VSTSSFANGTPSGFALAKNLWIFNVHVFDCLLNFIHWVFYS